MSSFYGSHTTKGIMWINRPSRVDRLQSQMLALRVSMDAAESDSEREAMRAAYCALDVELQTIRHPACGRDGSWL